MILSGRVVSVSRTRIECGFNALDGLRRMITSRDYKKSRIFILVDPGSGEHCLPILVKSCPELDMASVFEIEGGEPSKSINTAGKIWSELLLARADRKSLLINLGGGVVTDLGGFAAASIKRGIPYINVPTSLMGMADAAIGGKTAINLEGLKNQVGFFYPPAACFIDPVFLKTLPFDHIRSGLAEIIKSALVGDAVWWRKLQKQGVKEILSMDISDKFWLELIMKSVTFKNRIACQDFREQKLRKILNFGHTAGHGLESFLSGSNGGGFLHGDAVALGMIAETWISHLRSGLSEFEAMEIITFLKTGYDTQIGAFRTALSEHAFDNIFDILGYDKKNTDGKLRFTLLKAAGKPVVNLSAGRDELFESFEKLLESSR